MSISDQEHLGGPQFPSLSDYENPEPTSLMTPPEFVIPQTPPPLELGDATEKVTLAWKELSVYVPVPKSGFLRRRQPRHRPIRRVINNSSGIVTPGSLLAIMGESGAGKTSLMNILAHKLPPGICLDGEILVNGSRVGKEIGTISGYMYEDDLFFDTLTVSEHLQFMARIKLDRRIGKSELERRVAQLLSDLGLLNSARSRIGALSGGERKQLSFASEILKDPPLLFCDEPTTGLDSYSANKLVGMMRSLALTGGKTILCTIHQPSSQVFAMFDQLLLLADGRTAYMGPRAEAPKFFASIGYACPPLFNPADFFIQTLAQPHGSTTRRGEAEKAVRHICDSYSVSASSDTLRDSVQSAFKDFDAFDFRTGSTTPSITEEHRVLLQFQSLRTPGWLTKTCWLVWRSFLESIRNPKIHFIRTVQKIALALIIGFCFFDVGDTQKSQVGIQNIKGAIFLFITESSYPVMYGVVHVFPLEMPVFLRESQGGLYGMGSYYIAKTLSLIPGFVLDPVVFVSIAYWIVGFRPALDAFLYTVLIIILTSNAAGACGFLFSAASDSICSAFTFLIPFDYVLFVAGGILINLDSIPVTIGWVKYLSWFMFSNEAISITQWSGVTDIACDALADAPCLSTGDEVLSSYTFSPSNFLLDIIGLTSLIITFHALAFLALLIKTRRK